MKTFLPVLTSVFAALVTPVLALPVLQHVQVGNVTSNSASICWDVTESAIPGLAVFSDAAGTQAVTTAVRIEFQPLDNSRREVSTSYAARQSNRSIQSQMATKLVGLARVTGLAPQTQYFLRPLALNAAGATLASGSLIPVTTAKTSTFVPESRQLVVDLSPIVGTTGDVAGALLIASNALSPYPLISVVGDSFSPTVAYFDLSCFLNAAGESNLLPASGALDLTLGWLGLQPLAGTFSPSAVTYTGATKVAEATDSVFIGQGGVVHAMPTSPYAVAGLPFFLDLSVTDVGGVLMPGFNRALIIESPALSAGSGATPLLAAGLLSSHALVFGTPGTHTVTVRDSAGSSSTTVNVRVIQMNYQNWRSYHLGNNVGGGTGEDPDHDGSPNFVEYVLGSNPSRSSGSVVGVSSPGASALRLRFNLNPLQTEYAVVIQVTRDLAAWHRSAKVPTVVESHSDHKVMEVSWTAVELEAETGAAGPGYFARLMMEPASNFNTWLDAYSLTGPSASPAANPDGDQDPNFVEFALDSNPASGVVSGKVQHNLVALNGGTAQVLTIPMRLGAIAAASDPPGGELVFDADGVRYRIMASTNLFSWGVDMQEIPVDASSLPVLSSGYEYRSFRTPGGAPYRLEFVRVLVEQLTGS